HTQSIPSFPTRRSYDLKEADQKLRERLSNVNGALAADRMVDSWEKIAEQNNLINNPIDVFLASAVLSNRGKKDQHPSLMKKIKIDRKSTRLNSSHVKIS